jgi:RNA polymerase sigma-70 factor (ECF subfamily)
MEPVRELVAYAPWASEIPVAALESALAHVLESAAAAHPELPAPGPEFVRHLADRAGASLEGLARLRGGDCYLAFACLRGSTSAFQTLESAFLNKLRVRGASREQQQEVLQLLRTRLLVAGPGQTPKLEQYRGDGPLLAWLQMIAARTAIELHRKEPRPELQQRAFSDPDLVVDPELDFLKLRYAAEFQRALDRALTELPDGDATLLKLCYLNQTPPAALAAMYGVSTRTVQRRIAEVREQILSLTRGHLQAELSLQPKELDSLMALVQSQLHLSLRRLGKPRDEASPR